MGTALILVSITDPAVLRQTCKSFENYTKTNEKNTKGVSISSGFIGLEVYHLEFIFRNIL